MQSSRENLSALAAAILLDDSIPDIGLGHSQDPCMFAIKVNGVNFRFRRHTYSKVSSPWVQYTVDQTDPALQGESCIYVYSIPPDAGDPAGCRAALSGALDALAAKEPKMRAAIQWAPTGPYAPPPRI